MTTQEFSLEFDILYDNIRSQAAPGLDEYEKSVLLTKSQEDLIINIYKGNQNNVDSFEETELQRRYLDKLIKQITITNKINISDVQKLEGNSVFFELPEDLMVITLERLKVTSTQSCYNNKILDVIPKTQDIYLTQIKNPFRLPTMKGRTNQAWRLDYGNNQTRVVEIIAPKEVVADNYILRYIKKPNPIILENLNGGLTIDGQNQAQTCELDEIFHRQILEVAVMKGLQLKVIGEQ